MDGTGLPLSAPSVLQRLVTNVIGGADVVLLADHAEGQTLLDLAADDLSAHRSRTIRVSTTAAAGLSGAGLLAQVAGQPVAHDRDDQDLARDFKALTTLDEGCDRIVLLVSDAHALQPSALRFIQLACRSSADLQLVFAGAPSLFKLLDEPEFADLATRLERTTLAAAPPIIAAPLPVSVIPRSTAPTSNPIVPLPSSAASSGRMLPASATSAATDPIVALPPVTPRQPNVLVAATPLAPRARITAPGSAQALGRSRPSRRPGRATAAGMALTALIVLGVYTGRAEAPKAPADTTASAAKLAAAPPLATVPSTISPQPKPAAAPITPRQQTVQAAPPASPPVLTSEQDTTAPAQATGAGAPTSASVTPPEAPRSQATAPQAARPTITRREPAPARAFSRYTHAGPREEPGWYDPYSRPSPLSQQARAPQPAPDPYYRWTPNPPGSNGVIGTYTTDANGIRSFRYGP